MLISAGRLDEAADVVVPLTYRGSDGASSALGGESQCRGFGVTAALIAGCRMLSDLEEVGEPPCALVMWKSAP